MAVEGLVNYHVGELDVGCERCGVGLAPFERGTTVSKEFELEQAKWTYSSYRDKRCPKTNPTS
jgi:hypothetical protein